ncbi:hypothetical protein Cgig2_005624 [Carnegiea gigantea]|uniref:Uncharacterized protein n=1 Tax=Carnegiea gigantea TaxID=171969 RepID=A0A9Q1KUF3_9CARY|nr:hypothetical protein Cgig2_005624 [Carnegiea gigantea]
MLKQQGKFKWIRHWDDNTRLFFAKTKQRKLSSYIFTLTAGNGTTIEGFNQVGNMMLNYYKNLLGTQTTLRSCINMNILQLGGILDAEQQISLYRPISPRDVKEVLFSISNHKSPRPDGFSSGLQARKVHYTCYIQCSDLPNLDSQEHRNLLKSNPPTDAYSPNYQGAYNT